MRSGLESSFVARQAIVDLDVQTIGYELLFRDGWNNFCPDVDSDEATSNLILDNHLDNSIDKLVGDRKAFINFTESSLVKSFPEVFDKKKVVVEILETVNPCEQVIEACESFKSKGYTLALDDHDFDEKWGPLNSLVDIIKIDISCFSPEELADRLKDHSAEDGTLLAERVETHEQFKFCKELGFSLFQGYFFAKPEVIEKKKISANKFTMVQLLGEVASTPMDLKKVREIVSHDANLTFKLLRFINSPGFGKITEIKSIDHAVIYLGEVEMRKFVSLVAMGNVNDDKPPALMLLAAVRARFCEKLVVGMGMLEEASGAYLCGLLSLIDAVLDLPMDHVLSNLPVDDSIKRALLGDDGLLSNALKLVLAYEIGDWPGVKIHSETLGVEDASLWEHYVEALHWAGSLERSM